MNETMRPVAGQPFDAAPFARPLAEGCGLIWDDPREIHRVTATFDGAVPQGFELQYWRCKWPQVRLPKDHAEGRGSAGWWQLGDWFNGEWRTADAEMIVAGNAATFTFRPVCATEFPDVAGFDATFRTTMKLRLSCNEAPVHLSAMTDSTWERRVITVLSAVPYDGLRIEAFNGHIESADQIAPGKHVVSLWCAANCDPHTFDKTLLTISGAQTVTVALDDLVQAPVWIADYGLCVVAGEEARDYAGVCSEAALDARPGIYEMVAHLPEQSWRRAWDNMVPKRSRLCLPLAPDGSRHKFALNPDGSLRYRTNNEVLLKCRGADSERLEIDCADIHLSFGLPSEHASRTIEDGILPVGMTTWDTPEGTVEQVGFATILSGTDPEGPAPAADTGGVCMLKFTFTGSGTFRLPLRFEACGAAEELSIDEHGLIRAGDKVRALIDTSGMGELVAGEEGLEYSVALADSERHEVILTVPYVWPTPDEVEQLQALDFDRERKAVGDYWRRVLGAQMELVTPEDDLNEFFTSVAMHSLINSELEPNSRRRFARAGSFSYLAFANESCMMITDLDRRGMHEAARECLEGFLHYQGTVPLPGDFRSQEGVLWGAAGYEHIGYNQHHGWILWCLVEHFRFTRDEEWLRSVAAKVLAAADWIINERERGLPADSPEAGLLPPGNLEDITDWWPWLSTNCYTWRGLNAAAWGLAQIGHPDAGRLQAKADEYRQAIITCFTRAAERSPVVRLRNGTYVPHIPSHVYRRGRSFGWICETLEGAIHLLITGILDTCSREARWIINDYEDNLYLSEQYGYCIEDYARHWFDWGGFSMQACLLFQVEPYLYRDDVKHALRSAFNALAANYYPDTRMAAEHALPELGDWRGDHYKSPDEANACGWLRYLFVREDGDDLIVGQAVPESWLEPGRRCGVKGAMTHFGAMSLVFEGGQDAITVHLDAPRRNPPELIKLRLRTPAGRKLDLIDTCGPAWVAIDGDWVSLPGDCGKVTVTAKLAR